MDQENRDHQEGVIPDTAEEEIARDKTLMPEAPPVAHDNPLEYFPKDQQAMFVAVADSSSLDQFMILAREAWNNKHK